MDNKVFAESRLYIFVGILICSIFTIPLYWYTRIFGQPVFEEIKDLSMGEVILFGSTSILTGIAFILLCVSIIFMIIRLFVPAKITIDNYCIKYGFKDKFIPWSEILDIEYYSILKYGKRLFLFYIFMNPVALFNINTLLYVIRLLLIMSQPEDFEDIISIKLMNNKIIILPIDGSFVPGEEKLIDILKACKNATIRREYLSGKMSLIHLCRFYNARN